MWLPGADKEAVDDQLRGRADRDRVTEDDVRLIQQVSTATSPSNIDFMRPAQARELHRRPALTSMQLVQTEEVSPTRPCSRLGSTASGTSQSRNAYMSTGRMSRASYPYLDCAVLNVTPSASVQVGGLHEYAHGQAQVAARA